MKHITSQVTYYAKVDVYEQPSEVIKAVHNSVVPADYQKKGPRAITLMSSLEVCVTPMEADDSKHKYYGMTNPSYRKRQFAVPRKNGDRINGKTHPKSRHELRRVQSALECGG